MQTSQTGFIETRRLKLVLQSPGEVRELIDALGPTEKAELSRDWLGRVESAVSADPWVHGFNLLLRVSDVVIGKAGFKGPPGADGAVEIAYYVGPDYEGSGYATEAAEALTAFAFESGQVRVVRAHTLPEAGASQRVLTKCGFRNVGPMDDPEDGLVWRWEKEQRGAG